MRIEPQELNHFTEYKYGTTGDDIYIGLIRPELYVIEYQAEWEGIVVTDYYDDYEEVVDAAFKMIKEHQWNSVYESKVKIGGRGIKVPYEIYPKIPKPK
jgi:hypothetical protein